MRKGYHFTRNAFPETRSTADFRCARNKSYLGKASATSRITLTVNNHIHRQFHRPHLGDGCYIEIFIVKK